MVADEGVQQETVGSVTVARAGEGPDVVYNGAEHQGAFVLFHESRRWARPPSVDAEHRVRSRGIVKERPRAPVETLAMFRRQEERRIAIAEAGRPLIAMLLWRLDDRRQFGAGDERPVIVQPEWRDGLID